MRFLKPSQIFFRLWYKFSYSEVDLSPPPKVRKIKGSWKPHAFRRKSFDTKGTFVFLNTTKQLKEVGWDGPNCEKLWRYNQHYFDDLNALDADKRHNLHHELILDWIKKNPPSQGTGWEPYPTSLRIVNWIKWSLAGYKLPDYCLQSLAVQARWLSKNIEWHILGNHLFANAKALVFAGSFFCGKEAQQWLDRGMNIINKELNEQVLKDGGHFELSPMYHSIFLEDVLDLINISGALRNIVSKNKIKKFYKVAKQMLTWLNDMCHPDDEISFFNDAAHGVAASPSEIKSYAKRLGFFIKDTGITPENLSIKHYPNSGYIQIGTPDARVLLDVASIGPEYLPGHGHADTLSFEMSLFGKRLMVNGGTSQYETGATRLKERGTSAHNTVVVNGLNSSEVWSSFRVGRRANPIGLIIDKTNTCLAISCSHDGYQRFRRPLKHKRSWLLSNKNLEVHDKVDGEFTSAKAYFHLHPDIQVVSRDKFKCRLRISDNKYVSIFAL